MRSKVVTVCLKSLRPPLQKNTLSKRELDPSEATSRNTDAFSTYCSRPDSAHSASPSLNSTPDDPDPSQPPSPSKMDQPIHKTLEQEVLDHKAVIQKIETNVALLL